MSTEAVSWALGVQGLPPRAKLVLIGLADSADKATWTCYPSRKSLAEIGGCSVDTVDRAIATLVEEGHIQRDGRARDGGGQSSNLYTVNPSRKIAAPPQITENPAAETRPPLREIAAPGAAEMPRGEPQSYAAGGAARDAAPYEPLLEPSLEPVVVAVGRTPGFKEMVAEAQDRAGNAVNLTSGDVHHCADLNRLIRAGCDWDQDILPAIDRLAASFRGRRKQFSSWKLLNDAAIDNRDRRIAGLPPPAPPVEQQQRRGARESMSSVIDRVFAEEEAKREQTR